MTAANNISLPAFAVFGGMLAAAGIPIYIFAPTFYAENYGLGLTSIAAVLFWLRLVDAVQDPLLGWASENIGRERCFWYGDKQEILDLLSGPKSKFLSFE